MTNLESSQSIYNFLITRRSAAILVDPAPDRDDLNKILKIAGTVPDHGALKPYRFVVIHKKAQDAFGEGLVNAAEEAKASQLEPGIRLKIKAKAFAAPIQILIIFSPIVQPKIPDWEQRAAASCTGFALNLAANSLGFGAVWKNFAYAPGTHLVKLLHLQKSEVLLGWINIGTAQENVKTPREDFDLARYVTYLGSEIG